MSDTLLGVEDMKYFILAYRGWQSIVRDIHVSKSLEYKVKNVILLTKDCKITKEKSFLWDPGSEKTLQRKLQLRWFLKEE